MKHGSTRSDDPLRRSFLEKDRHSPSAFASLAISAQDHRDVGTSAIAGKQKAWTRPERIARALLRHAWSHADRRGHRCPSAPAMQHSSAADGP